MAAGGPQETSPFARLSQLGLLLLAAAVGVFVLREKHLVSAAIGDDLLILGGAGALLVLLAHLGPLIESVKAGKDGIEISFGSQVNAKVLELTDRLAKLQAQVDECCAEKDAHPAAGRGRSQRATSASAKAAAAPPPGLSLPVTHPDDQNKGRFGGTAQSDGFTLSASFAAAGKDSVTIRLTVQATEPPRPGEMVQFYLHESFPKRVVSAAFVGDTASIEFWSWGGFTAGAWIPSRQIQLELDLSQMDTAPRIVRDR